MTHLLRDPQALSLLLLVAVAYLYGFLHGYMLGWTLGDPFAWAWRWLKHSWGRQ